MAICPTQNSKIAEMLWKIDEEISPDLASKISKVLCEQKIYHHCSFHQIGPTIMGDRRVTEEKWSCWHCNYSLERKVSEKETK